MRKRSRRTPRPVLLPLGIKRLNYLEWPGHVALMALGQPWMTEEHLADLAVACQIGIDLAPPDDPIHQAAKEGKARLFRRELDGLTPIIGPVIQWITYQPNKAIHDATKRRLDELYESQAIS